ncbi:BTAD domain-containing putative transcriptional regulator [Ancylobacter sp.]|uniref:BTAD domain-containing putative transcriptional regulator n=1 Tax=Ancylobacter sp. TaxID=1872567 RepID=UPI003BAA9AD2
MSGKTNLLIQLLGSPKVATEAKHSPAFPTRGLGLLALLATSPGQAMGRAQAAAHLWESRDTSTNFGNLRQLLFRMSRAMPEFASLLQVDDKIIRIALPEAIDVCRFLSLQELVSEVAARQLMSLYRGDLLQNVELDGLPSPEPLMVARAYLRERYFSFINSAIMGLTHYGHANQALLLDLEHHALGIDSGREEVYRALVAAYGAIGRADEARRVFAKLTAVLRQDGSGTPELATRASLTRATIRTIEVQPSPNARRYDGRYSPEIPRVALLAPRWVNGAASSNFLRAFVEDTANELARHRTVTALAAHSSFGATSDGGMIEDNSQLRADYAVSSFVRPGEGELSVRLVNNTSGAIVWAGEYPLGQRLAVSSNRILVARIVAALTEAVMNDRLFAARRSEDASAYVSFLKAQLALKTCDLRSVRRARRLFSEAISQDDRFADAYSGASCSLYLEWLLLGGNDPRLLSQARELSDLAIQQDPENSTGYWRRAMVALYQRHFDDSQRYFELAEERHPNSADILLDHSDAMGFVGDANMAWRTFERALDLNPSPPDHYWWAGASIAFSQADYGKAIALCGKLASEESVLRLLAASHGQLGNISEAREYGDRLREAYPTETAESMTRLQPHRTKADMQPFIEGLRVAGIK